MFIKFLRANGTQNMFEIARHCFMSSRPWIATKASTWSKAGTVTVVNLEVPKFPKLKKMIPLGWLLPRLPCCKPCGAQNGAKGLCLRELQRNEMKTHMTRTIAPSEPRALDSMSRFIELPSCAMTQNYPKISFANHLRNALNPLSALKSGKARTAQHRVN